MSAQSSLPDDDFGLIETLRWTREGGYWLLAGHLARLRASAAALGFVFSQDAWGAALAQGRAGGAPALRVRLELRREGEFRVAATPFSPDPEDKIWRVVLAEKRFDSDEAMLRHKTTRRARYEEVLAEAQERDPSLDEIVFLNQRDEICEGARTNLFVLRDGALLTPPLACGLLPGVLRADLLARGLAREEVLTRADLAGDFFLGNSLRGLLKTRLIG